VRGISILFCLGVLACPRAVEPAILYVSPSSPNPASPYSSWNSAATRFRCPWNVAQSNDVVLVTNGVVRHGQSCRLLRKWPIVWRSLMRSPCEAKRPAVTVIQGAARWATSAGAVRIRWYERRSLRLHPHRGKHANQWYADHMSGAGARCESSAILKQLCFVRQLRLPLGWWRLQWVRSTTAASSATPPFEGGGAFNSTCTAALSAGNSASSGLGVPKEATFYNCIVYFNAGANYSGASFQYSCTTPSPRRNGKPSPTTRYS